jgi:acetyltransferase-like isoleucine patch superfamily enzyme
MIRLLPSPLLGLLSRRALLGRISGNISSQYRLALLRHFGAKIGARNRFSHPFFLLNCRKDFSRLSLGDNVFIGHHVLMDLSDRIDISNDVTLSMNVVISTHIDVGSIPLAKLYPRQAAPVRIHPNVYVGTGAILLAGITIGPNAVIAAGAVVRKDVPPGSVVGGVPARVLKPLPPGSFP